MAAFDDFVKELKGEVKDLVETSWADVKSAATKDARDLLNSNMDDLKRWTKLVEQGKLELDDLEFLLKGKKDLAKMSALRRAGVAKVKIDKFFMSLVSTIVKVAAKAFL